MQIHGPTHLHGAQSINSPHRVAGAPTTSEAPSSMPMDQVDISPEARLLSQIHDLPDIRADRVAQLRAQIASGTYETEERISKAIDGFLDEFA